MWYIYMFHNAVCPIKTFSAVTYFELRSGHNIGVSYAHTRDRIRGRVTGWEIQFYRLPKPAFANIIGYIRRLTPAAIAEPRLRRAMYPYINTLCTTVICRHLPAIFIQLRDLLMKSETVHGNKRSQNSQHRCAA